MKITLNGELKELSENITVKEFLAQLGVPLETVAVELDLNILPKARFADTVLRDGDRVEVVSFVGGG